MILCLCFKRTVVSINKDTEQSITRILEQVRHNVIPPSAVGTMGDRATEILIPPHPVSSTRDDEQMKREFLQQQSLPQFQKMLVWLQIVHLAYAILMFLRNLGNSFHLGR